MSEATHSIRLDRWLHHARVFKTRSIASASVTRGGVRLNGKPCAKPGQAVRQGDTITVSNHGQVRALKVLGFGERRGPATEAAELYQELEA